MQYCTDIWQWKRNLPRYNVWTVVKFGSVPNIRTVGAKWVSSQMIDGKTSKPSKYKARWVAKGYSQIEVVNHNELFAAIAHQNTIRRVLAVVNHWIKWILWPLVKMEISKKQSMWDLLGSETALHVPSGQNIADLWQNRCPGSYLIDSENNQVWQWQLGKWECWLAALVATATSCSSLKLRLIVSQPCLS